MVPQRSVSEIQGQYSVMILTDSNTVEAKTIQVGEKVDDAWQVTDGLTGTETLVFEGLQKVRSGSKVVTDTADYKFEIEE